MKPVTKSMKGVYLNGHGGFDKIEFNENIPLPILKNNEVLIKIHAAGVNNTDINTRIAWYSKNNISGNNTKLASEGMLSRVNNDGSWSGQGIEFPRIQGIDGCGKIVDVGSAVNKSRVGERVLINPCMKIKNSYFFLGSEINGCFAEYTKVQSEFALKINSKLSSDELATFPCSYSTAENMLNRTRLLKNEKVLITGASGGVGSACIQLASLRSAKIIAVSNINKKQQIKKINSGMTINYDEIKTISDNSVDVVIDLLGGNFSNILISKLKKFGRYATAGAVTGPIADIDLRTIYLQDLKLFGCTVLDDNIFKNLISYIEKNKIKPLLARSFPLNNMVEAQKFFLEKNFLGKVVISICNSDKSKL